MARPVTHAVSFAELPGWHDDPLDDALCAFAQALPALVAHVSGWPLQSDLRAHCAAAADLVAAGVASEAAARDFFEQRFVPHVVHHDGPDGLLTGYYEPVLAGSRHASAAFPVPILRRPPDLVTLVDDALRASAGTALTHGRKGPDGVVPYPTRQEIEQGALEDFDLALLHLTDPVDAFFLHVQGSGLIELNNGERIRIGYDGKNGHPYSSVGRYIISRGALTAQDATLDSIKDWLKADAHRGREAMWQNASYIFFRELGPASETATLGVRNIPLTAGRSLAVDAEYHEIGLPVFLVAPSLDTAGTGQGLRRLMMAQDVGSAIRGPERGDFFYGVGDQAGRLAGSTKHRCNFFLLMPKPAGSAGAS